MFQKSLTIKIILLIVLSSLYFTSSQAKINSRNIGNDFPQNLSGKKLLLIPAPQKIEMKKGSFLISGSDKVVLANYSRKDDHFSAEQLKDEIKNDLFLDLKISKTEGRKYILIGQIGKDKKIISALNKLKIAVPSDLSDEGYILNISPSHIIVAGKTSAGTFYGIQTLKQIIRSNRDDYSIPCLTIIDYPSLKYRGWMDDISRGPIPTMDFLKKEVRILSEYKLNFFNLYTENVFKLKAYPDIAPEDGLTAEQVEELSDYASKYHIQLIGNFQSFGHFYKILKSPFYADMRETKNIISPAVPQTYDFLSKVYSEVVPAYKSKFFNINCDETFGLGEGKAKQMVDSLGLGEVYAYHINKIYNLLKPYGKRIMMWGDIAVNNKSIIDELPKNLIVLSWGYSPNESFDYAIKPFKDAGFDFMVAPGVSCWNRIYPALSDAAVNISNYVRDGAKYGAMGMMNTAWDDDGENFFNNNWYGMIWGAECSWKPELPASGSKADKERNERLSDFNHAFDANFYGLSKVSVTQALLELDSIRKYPVKNILNDSGFWEDVLDFNEDNTSDVALINNLQVESEASLIVTQLTRLKKIIPRNNSNLDYATFAARRVRFEAQKNILRVKLYKVYQKPDSNYISKTKNDIDTLLSHLHQLKMEYVRLWERENRSWWLDHILAKYDDLGDQLLNAENKVFIKPANKVAGNQRMVSLRTIFNNKKIYYTLDGTEPTLGANIYTNPFSIEHSSIIRACVMENGRPSENSQEFILVDKAIGKLYRLNSNYNTYNTAYSGGGDSALVDGLFGSSNYADGHWQGYQGQNLNVILDMKKKMKIKDVSIRFLQNSFSWILMPKEVKILFSDDGIHFHTVKVIDNMIDPKVDGTIIHKFKSEFDNAETRYIQVIGVSPGRLPKWHHAAGRQAYIFADEVIVN